MASPIPAGRSPLHPHKQPPDEYSSGGCSMLYDEEEEIRVRLSVQGERRAGSDGGNAQREHDLAGLDADGLHGLVWASRGARIPKTTTGP